MISWQGMSQLPTSTHQLVRRITSNAEFGSLQGYVAILTKALYGLKTSTRAWRLHLSEVLENQLSYKSCLVDPDIWLREAGKENHKYYKMLLVYMDDILVIFHRAKEAMSQLDQHFLVKKDSIGPPTTYLGTQVGKYTFPDKLECTYWSLGSEKYVKNVVRQAKRGLAKRGQTLESKVTLVLPLGYRPELDVSDECGEEDVSFYHSQIGILRWAVELGRIDITTVVSMLASFMVSPRVGHLHAIMHMFGYLNCHEYSCLVFDSREFAHPCDTQGVDWTRWYPEAKEVIPPNTWKRGPNDVLCGCRPCRG